MSFPHGYDWLGTIGQLPRTISEGLALIGVHELHGAGSNATILAWRDELNAAGVTISGYSDDDIPWCGLFAAIVAHRAGKAVVTSPLWARNWANFGSASPQAGLGDILVFARGGSGHVGFYVAEDATAYHVLGGNQGDQVSIVRVLKARLLTARRPIYHVQPASVKPYHAAPSGGLSSNEK